MTSLPKISIVICTRDRSQDLADLLSTIFEQNYAPLEVIIVDDSRDNSTKTVCDNFASKNVSKLLFCVGSQEGLTAARNLGIKAAKGDVILFLDDDILLNRSVFKSIAEFLRDNPSAMGVQPRILPVKLDNRDMSGFQNAIHKALMIYYFTKDESRARRSGSFVYPQPLTKTISVQRFSGCCCCYRREVFVSESFDTNLKRWGFSEDLDFSYRAYKKNPEALYIVPSITVVHKSSPEGRLELKSTINMRTVYWFYLFFKNMFNSSILNLATFLWAIEGEIVINLGALIAKRKPRAEWWSFIYLLCSHILAFKNLKNILRGQLEFFNASLNTKKDGVNAI
jgi:glucosyl-dolichyl phosphate glucuronosyltransferase